MLFISFVCLALLFVFVMLAVIQQPNVDFAGVVTVVITLIPLITVTQLVFNL